MDNENKRGRKPKKPDYNNIFAKRLRGLLEETGTKQQEIADNIGISRQALNKWVNGETVPDIFSAVKIADFFNVSIEYITGRSKTKSKDIGIEAAQNATGLSEDVIKNIGNKLIFPKYYSDINSPQYNANIFTEFYYQSNQYILNTILSCDYFWEIINQISSILNAGERIKKNHPNHNYIMNNVDPFSQEGVETFSEYCDISDIYDGIDLNRYKIVNKIERICDIFDIRINKECEANGKHNPSEE